MKVVYLEENITKSGGVTKVISLWSNYLVQKNYSVEIVSTVPGNPFFSLKDEVKLSYLNLYVKNKIHKILFLFLNTIIFYKWYKNIDDSVMIFNKAFYIEILYILKKLRLLKKSNRLIYFAHGGNEDFEGYYKERFLTRHRTNMIFKTFDEVVCLFKNIETQDKFKINFIPNPLELKIEKNLEKENLIIFVGRITYEKGVDTLIKAWEEIHSSYPNWKLFLLGDGKDRKVMEEMGEKIKNNQLVFVGETKEVEEYYRKAKIFVLPSKFEGLPMVMLEAMTKGCFIISSDTAGGKKLIKDSYNGFLFEIGNEKELAQKLKYAIENEVAIKKMPENSYEEIEEYSIDILYKKWEKLLNKKEI